MLFAVACNLRLRSTVCLPPVDCRFAQFVLDRNLHRLPVKINGHGSDNSGFALSQVGFSDRVLVDFLHGNAGDSGISLEGVFLPVELGGERITGRITHLKAVNCYSVGHGDFIFDCVGFYGMPLSRDLIGACRSVPGPLRIERSTIFVALFELILQSVARILPSAEVVNLFLATTLPFISSVISIL